MNSLNLTLDMIPLCFVLSIVSIELTYKLFHGMLLLALLLVNQPI
jgi:hypothetical protein